MIVLSFSNDSFACLRTSSTWQVRRNDPRNGARLPRRKHGAEPSMRISEAKVKAKV